MFDIAWSEIALIAAVALVAIGPKDLPKALYTAGKWMRSARKVAAEFQRHVDDMMREAELEELKKTVQQARTFNLKQHLEQTIDPQGELKKGVDLGRNLDPTAGSALPPQPGRTGSADPPASLAPAPRPDPAPPPVAPSPAGPAASGHPAPAAPAPEPGPAGTVARPPAGADSAGEPAPPVQAPRG